jgi:predicted transposase YdaD
MRILMMNSTIEYVDGRKSLLEYSEVKNVSGASFADGRLSEKKSCAKNMLAKSFDLKTISELTGLSEAEIGNL